MAQHGSKTRMYGFKIKTLLDPVPDPAYSEEEEL
jgi:hypothetical protein